MSALQGPAVLNQRDMVCFGRFERMLILSEAQKRGCRGVDSLQADEFNGFIESDAKILAKVAMTPNPRR